MRESAPSRQKKMLEKTERRRWLEKGPSSHHLPFLPSRPRSASLFPFVEPKFAATKLSRIPTLEQPTIVTVSTSRRRLVVSAEEEEEVVELVRRILVSSRLVSSSPFPLFSALTLFPRSLIRKLGFPGGMSAQDFFNFMFGQAFFGGGGGGRGGNPFGGRGGYYEDDDDEYYDEDDSEGDYETEAEYLRRILEEQRRRQGRGGGGGSCEFIAFDSLFL